MENERYKIYQGDCLDILKGMPSKSVDLCLTDPPYGLRISSNPVRQKFAKQDWDYQTPADEIFKEIFRVSKNQIIWGGNYFNLPPTQCFLVWNKLQPENFSLAMCEMAWTSFKSPAKMFTESVLAEKHEFHPTQKSLRLMQWCIEKYSNQNDVILDCFAGSFTTGVACAIENRNFIGIEIDPHFVAVGKSRIERALGQPCDIPQRITTDKVLPLFV